MTLALFDLARNKAGDHFVWNSVDGHREAPEASSDPAIARRAVAAGGGARVGVFNVAGPGLDEALELLPGHGDVFFFLRMSALLAPQPPTKNSSKRLRCRPL